MSTATSTRRISTREARPSVDELMVRAASLRPVIAEHARATEVNRRVSSDMIKLLADEGLLSMTKPARFGGYEYGPSTLVRLGYEIGQVCGSTAWCAALANCNALFVSYWSTEAQRDVWGENPGNLVAAPLAPTGKCEKADSGYRVWGSWPFASNCENSQWTVISAVVPGDDGEPAGPAWFLTPMSTVRVDQDTWHMAGLQGTGSKTLVADEPIFVPAHRMVRMSDVIALTTPGALTEGNPLARFGWSTFGAAALIAPLLGMARGALDWFVDNMRSKVRPGAKASAAEHPFVQEVAGRAETMIDAALGLVLRDLEEAEAIVFAGGALDDGRRIRLRRDCGFAARQAVEVVNSLFEASGASSADLDRPIQRFWRDVNAGANHVSLNERAIMAMVGQHLFGLPPNGQY